MGWAQVVAAFKPDGEIFKKKNLTLISLHKKRLISGYFLKLYDFICSDNLGWAQLGATRRRKMVKHHRLKLQTMKL